MPKKSNKKPWIELVLVMLALGFIAAPRGHSAFEYTCRNSVVPACAPDTVKDFKAGAPYTWFHLREDIRYYHNSKPETSFTLKPDYLKLTFNGLVFLLVTVMSETAAAFYKNRDTSKRKHRFSLRKDRE